MEISAESRVVASFTFVAALLLGAWVGLSQLVAGPAGLLPEEFGELLVALVPFAVTAVAFQAWRATDQAWARTLGGATVLLGALECVAGILYFLSAT